MHHFQKPILIVLFLFVSMQLSNSQTVTESIPTFRERLFMGGNLGLLFGTITDIEVSPIVGIWLLPRLSVAAGPQYRFYKYYDTKAHIYGGKCYTEFHLVQDLNNIIPIGLNFGLFAHLEDELLRVVSYDVGTRKTINTILVGGGISQPMGMRSSMNLMALWAVSGSGFDYYNNPEIRIVFNF